MAYYTAGPPLTGGPTFDLATFRDVEWAGTLAAIAQTERNQIFNVGIGGSFYSYPVVRDGVAYIGCCDKNVYAIDAATGREAWRFPTDGPLCGSALVWNGTLYIGSYDGCLYALALDGKLCWKFPTDAKVYSMPALATGLIVFGNQAGTVFAVTPEGERAWAFQANGAICSSPWHDNGVVYVGSFDRNLYALDAATGRERWHFAGSASMGSPTVADGVVYVPSFDGNLYALTISGRLLWKFAVEGQTQSTRPVVWDGTVYFMSRQGTLYAVRTDGTLRWKFATTNILFTVPTIENGVLYFGAHDRNFYALDARTGALRWKAALDDEVCSQAALCNGLLIYGTTNQCKVRALTLEGRPVWEFPSALSARSPVDVEPPARTFRMPQPLAQAAETKEEKYKAEGTAATAGFSTYVVKSQYTEKSVYASKRTGRW